jgi:hypothetical protein
MKILISRKGAKYAKFGYKTILFAFLARWRDEKSRC